MSTLIDHLTVVFIFLVIYFFSVCIDCVYCRSHQMAQTRLPLKFQRYLLDFFSRIAQSFSLFIIIKLIESYLKLIRPQS